MKTILVTGANGQLGRAVREMYKENSDIDLYNTDIVEMEDVHKLDITNVEEVVEVVEKIQPYAIINCAAHTGVDACESDVENAYRINAIGPRNLSIAAEKVGAKIVQISTDYVFEGNASQPYREFDLPNPQGIYGKSKLEGEKFVKNFSSKYFIIRTAWLYGDGKNFVKTMLRLAENNDEVRVVGDQFGSPTSTKVLANIIDTLIWTNNFGVYHGTCEGECSWADFAEEIFRLKGLKTKVNHIKTSEYPTPAKRPAYSVLDNYMLKITCGYVAEDWKEAIKEYCTNLK